MIGKLRGLVDRIGEQDVILDVQGVGYLVYCSASSLRSLPPTGQEISLFIDTHVREDHIHLYGFTTETEQYWFQQLLGVNGVGPRMALNVLSTLPPEQLSTAILSGDIAIFKPVSGVGPKLAERIIRELSNKATPPAKAQPAIQPGSGSLSGANADHILSEVLSAMTNLGYGRSEVYPVVAEITRTHQDASVELLIRESLQQLVK